MNTPSIAIFLPVACLALWTLTVLALVPLKRFAAAKAGRVTVGDFRTGESARVPTDVSIPNRVYINLLEAPVLFYAACIVAHVTGQADHLLVQMAWLYVALRLVHSFIYLVYNNVIHRLAAFATSVLVLVGIWAVLLMRLLALT
jgi:hypothetical protein